MKLQLAGKSETSQGHECALFGRVGVDGGFVEAAQGALAPSGSWRAREMSPGAGLTPVVALFADKAELPDPCEIGDRAVLLSHDWSGVVRVADPWREFRFDLHSRTTRLLLLDFVNELAVDISRLASVHDGKLHFPALTFDRIITSIAEEGAWFALMQPRLPPSLGPFSKWREAGRSSARTAARVRLLSLLVPALAARPPAAPSRPAAAPEGEDVRALQDRLRLVAAALDGVTRRLASDA